MAGRERRMRVWNLGRTVSPCEGRFGFRGNGMANPFSLVVVGAFAGGVAEVLEFLGEELLETRLVDRLHVGFLR